MFKRTNWKQNDGSVAVDHDSANSDQNQQPRQAAIEHWITGVIVTIFAFGVVIVRAIAQHQ